MLENPKVHFSADSKDLACPICYSAFGHEAHHPITTNCGHTVCSLCFEKISKCPFCQAHFDKRQKYQKSVLLSSLFTNSLNKNTCEEHSEIYQGFCLQDKAFVCFECLMNKHQGHKLITIKEINKRAEKARTVLQKAQKRKDSKHIELKTSLEAENKRKKRQLDEIIDQEISHLSLLKKKLYKEIDIQTISEEEQYQHKLLSEKLSKYCQSTEKMLQDWNKNQERDLAVQILKAPVEEAPSVLGYEKQVDLFRAEIPKKHLQSSNELVKDLNSILSNSSTKLKKSLAKRNEIPQIHQFPHVELAYLIEILKEYNFSVSVSSKNDVLELKLNNPTAFTPKFDPHHITCSLSKISLSCPDTLPFLSFHAICQILENVHGLKDVTLHLQKIENPEILALSHLISHLKALEKFSVQVDLAEVSKPALNRFMVELTRIEKLSSLKIQHKAPQTVISFQLNPSAIFEKLFESLQEISLDLDAIPEVLLLSLDPVNFSNAKYLKRFTISLGKTPCNPQVLDAVCKTLRLQSEIEELTFVCEDLSDSTSIDLSKFLSESTQKKKLAIFVNKLSISKENSLKSFLPESHATLKNLEEFTLKMNCSGFCYPDDKFCGLIEFLSTLKALKKLCLQFDDLDYCFSFAEKLFSQITSLQTLISLEIELLNFESPRLSERSEDLEAILNQLPSSVLKRCVFSRSPSNDEEERRQDSPSEYSEQERYSYDWPRISLSP